MEHVVFWSTAPGEPTFARVPDQASAVALVGELRNVHGITDATAHALTDVPLAIRTVYVVEVGADGATAPSPAAAPIAPAATPALSPAVTQVTPAVTPAAPAITGLGKSSAGVPALMPDVSPFRSVPALSIEPTAAESAFLSAATVPTVSTDDEGSRADEPNHGHDATESAGAAMTAQAIPAARVPALSVVPDVAVPSVATSEVAAADAATADVAASDGAADSDDFAAAHSDLAEPGDAPAGGFGESGSDVPDEPFASFNELSAFLDQEADLAGTVEPAAVPAMPETEASTRSLGLFA